MNEPNLMTSLTYKRLLKELEKAREHTSKRNIAIGAAAGPESDWHDNAAYDFAHTQYDVAAVSLQSLQDKLFNIKIIKPRQEINTIEIGNTVIIEFEDGRKQKITILGPDDYNTRPDWISFKTPLAQSILGKKSGKTVRYEFNGNKQKVKIIEVLPGEFEDIALASKLIDAF